MSKNITQSVLKVVACENILTENELNKPDNKSISELLNEQEEKENQKNNQSSNIEE